MTRRPRRRVIRRRQRDRASAHGGRSPIRRERGGVVTWAVVGLMLVSLLVYLVVAFVAEDPANAPEVESAPPAAEGSG
jgi:hypothetical protein